MRKLIRGLSILTVFLILLALLTGCNKSIIDTTYTFDEAIIKLPDGSVVVGKVQSWTDYKDGDQIQVKINDNVYLVHSSNITLMKE